MNFIIMLIVGGIAGWLASMLMRTNGQQGIILNIVVGIIGGFLGGWLLPMVGLSVGGWSGYLVTALIGAVILMAIVNLFRRGRVRGVRDPAVARKCGGWGESGSVRVETGDGGD